MAVRSLRVGSLTLKTAFLGVAFVLAICLARPAVAQEEKVGPNEELAKESQNPLGSIVSLPFESNFDFDAGPEDAFAYQLNFKPVYPLNFENVNLINRFILPVIYQEERVKGQGNKTGLGDFTYQAFFSPAKASKIIWGAGPAFVFPTNTNDRLGVDKWSAGLAAVALAKPGHWVVGALVSNVWSYAGDNDAPDVNSFSFQYFINYNFPNGWYLSSTPTITANWEATSDERWTVPVGGGIGRLVRFGKLPVDLKLQGFYNIEAPENAPDWSMQVQVKLLFPKGN
jgi:hypothetical protein